MIRNIIFKGKKVTTCLGFLFFLMLGFSCVNDSDENDLTEPSETASVSFAIAWHDEPVDQSLGKALSKYGAEIRRISAQVESVDCERIAEIVCEVYDETNNDLTSASFECSARQGTMDGPVGSNREFIVLGVDAVGDILYHGRLSGVTIVLGQTNDLGIIDVYPFYVSELLSPADNAYVTMETLSLTWEPCATADSYKVLISDNETFESLIVEGVAEDGSYVPSNLSPWNTYYWKVVACDTHGNHGPDSEEIWKFIIYANSIELYWYRDADSDGYGDPGVYQQSTDQPEGYVSNDLDCDDMDDTVYPGATEICGDGIDNQCPGDDGYGEVDEGCNETACADISGSWCGTYIEVDCFEESGSGSWVGEVGPDCSFIAYSDWGEFMSGNINPETLVLEATGEGDDCGPASITGQWTSDFVSGSFTYAFGGSGTFTGERCD